MNMRWILYCRPQPAKRPLKEALISRASWRLEDVTIDEMPSWQLFCQLLRAAASLFRNAKEWPVDRNDRNLLQIVLIILLEQWSELLVRGG